MLLFGDHEVGSDAFERQTGEDILLAHFERSANIDFRKINFGLGVSNGELPMRQTFKFIRLSPQRMCLSACQNDKHRAQPRNPVSSGVDHRVTSRSLFENWFVISEPDCHRLVETQTPYRVNSLNEEADVPPYLDETVKNGVLCLAQCRSCQHVHNRCFATQAMSANTSAG